MSIKDCEHDSWLESGMCLICAPPDGWQHNAECIKYNPDLMYPENDEPHLYEQARRVCEECPVVGFCLEIGINEKWGMWGGLEPTARAKLAKSGKLPRDKVERRKYLRVFAYTS